MFFDQSWMGYGVVGALEAGAIGLVAGLVVMIVLHLYGRTQGWSAALEIGWASVIAIALAGGSDLWNLLYFNYGRVQSLQLLRLRLAEVHDADNLGARVVAEILGVFIGVYLGWWLTRRGRSSE